MLSSAVDIGHHLPIFPSAVTSLQWPQLREPKVASMIASLEDLMRQSQSQAESLAHLQEVLAQELDGAKSPLAAPSAEEKSQHFAEAPLPTPRSESKDNVSCGHADTAENEEIILGEEELWALRNGYNAGTFKNFLFGRTKNFAEKYELVKSISQD